MENNIGDSDKYEPGYWYFPCVKKPVRIKKGNIANSGPGCRFFKTEIECLKYMKKVNEKSKMHI